MLSLQGCLSAVATMISPLEQGLQFAFDHRLAEWRDPVHKDFAFEMVKLMLHDTGEISSYPFLMHLTVGILIADLDPGGASHLW